MAEQIPLEKLEKMVTLYESTLRILLDDADHDARLFAHRLQSSRAWEPTNEEYGRNYVYERVRRAVAYALHEFHPEIPLKPEIDPE